MQTTLQKIGELLKNMLSHLTDPPFPSHKTVYIINDANVIEKSPRAVTKIGQQRLKLTQPP